MGCPARACTGSPHTWLPCPCPCPFMPTLPPAVGSPLSGLPCGHRCAGLSVGGCVAGPGWPGPGEAVVVHQILLARHGVAAPAKLGFDEAAVRLAGRGGHRCRNQSRCRCRCRWPGRATLRQCADGHPSGVGGHPGNWPVRRRRTASGHRGSSCDRPRDPLDLLLAGAGPEQAPDACLELLLQALNSWYARGVEGWKVRSCSALTSRPCRPDQCRTEARSGWGI